MASVADLSNRLRSELTDVGKTFIETFVGNGVTKTFNLSHYPINGADLKVISGTTDTYPVDSAQMTVKSGSTDISSTSTIEEHTGLLTLAAAPALNTIITVAGTYYRYFTDAEIQNYVNIAFVQHAGTAANAYGSKISLSNLPMVEEYPIVLLASTMALFTLATDAAYDIDIQAPDGVSIPRSERYRQLMDMIQLRKEQYRELCNLLGVGLHRIEVVTVRKISQRTNRYVPIYRAQELDDHGYPQRVHIPLPTYMDQTTSSVQTYDINLYRGDSFEVTIDFPFSLTDYSLLSQIRSYSGANIVLATFNINITDVANGKAKLSLTSDQTSDLPSRGRWDIQMTKKAIRPLTTTAVSPNTVAETAVKPGYKGTVAKAGFVTYKTNSAHGFTTGAQVTIENVAVLDSTGTRTLKNNYNGTFTITVFDATSFYVENSTTTTPYDTDGYTITDPDTNVVLSTVPAATAYYIDPTYEQTYLKGAVIVDEQITNQNNDPYAPGWQG